MIKDFKSKALEQLWTTGKSAKVRPDLQKRILRRLDALDVARSIADLKIPGFDFHALHGFDPPRYTIHINGPWCLTFEFEGAEPSRIDLEQYH
ncbi:type II toxin-antitoxin system RelE/ParE family toxin [Aurantimonas sp. A3-2-R12]|uniref:type II toxin-antitoxin system RelE/ParE family toxin n=1 Tax=Aurantimonas sp. A3-2-R12 TaxID=3114362 RepID=UPI002E16CA85|nr:type II toxin-antitoxin system RelE/ParE family toxin [Aurantimonas sp. A3-2-R12]